MFKLILNNFGQILFKKKYFKTILIKMLKIPSKKSIDNLF